MVLGDYSYKRMSRWRTLSTNVLLEFHMVCIHFPSHFSKLCHITYIFQKKIYTLKAKKLFCWKAACPSCMVLINSKCCDTNYLACLRIQLLYKMNIDKNARNNLSQTFRIMFFYLNFHWYHFTGKITCKSLIDILNIQYKKFVFLLISLNLEPLYSV